MDGQGGDGGEAGFPKKPKPAAVGIVHRVGRGMDGKRLGLHHIVRREFLHAHGLCTMRTKEMLSFSLFHQGSGENSRVIADGKEQSLRSSLW